MNFLLYLEKPRIGLNVKYIVSHDSIRERLSFGSSEVKFCVRSIARGVPQK